MFKSLPTRTIERRIVGLRRFVGLSSLVPLASLTAHNAPSPVVTVQVGRSEETTITAADLRQVSMLANMYRIVNPPDSIPATAPAVPVLPDLVTVVPFQLDHGFILVPAEIDGRRGTFHFDTGAQLITLRSKYIRAHRHGGLDTVVAGNDADDSDDSDTFITVHTLHIGTLRQHLDSIDVGPPTPRSSNARISNWNFLDFVETVHNGPILGNLGLNAMEPFETIIDYTHQRLILIRLDASGHRLAAVPAYTPAATVPLVAIIKRPHSYWGVQAHMGDSLVTLIVDTGGRNKLDKQMTQYLGTRVVPTNESLDETPLGTLDHLVLGGRSYDTLSFKINFEDTGLGFDFLNRLGVVGFNFRTHQLILYK